MQAVLDSPCGDLSPRIELESLQNARDVVGDSARCQNQLLGNVSIWQTAREQARDFTLAGSQRGDRDLTIPGLRRAGRPVDPVGR